MDGSKFGLEKLKSGCYESWQFKVEMLLVRENLWKHVAEAAPEPPTAAWQEGDAKARATIVLLVDDSQHPLIRTCKTAKETWDELKKHHQKTTMSTRVSLLKKLCKAEYNDDGDMEGHLFRMEELFACLANAGQELESSLKVAMVLKSMPDSFDTLTTALESRSDEELTMELVKGKLLDEAQKRAEKSHRGESILRASGDKKPIVCHNCHKPGHVKRECPATRAGRESNSGRPNHVSNQKKNVKSKATVGMVTPFAFMATTTAHSSKVWIVDSGATSHMCCDRSFFSELKPSSGISITLADGNETLVRGVGSGRLFCQDEDGQRQEVILSGVFYVPELESNLISVGSLVAKGAEVIFSDRRGCVIQRDGVVAAVARKVGGLYQLKLVKEHGTVASHHKKNCIHHWHRKLGHRDPEAIQQAVRDSLATGVTIQKCGVFKTCECCVEGKISRLPFPRKEERQSSKVLDIVHTDICGPMNTVSLGGSRYFLTMIDDYSRYTVVYFLKKKSEAADIIEDYVSMAKNRFGRCPTVIRSDQGGEYKSKRLGWFYRVNGIAPQYTAGYAPEQNGVAERKNRSIVEMARCMLIDAKMGYQFWAEAVNTAVHLQNMLPSRSVERTPFELWYGKKPDYGRLHIFGCTAFVHVPTEKRSKLAPKGVKMTFVGYSDCHKAFRFIDQATKKVVISRDVRFVEMEDDVENEGSTPSVTSTTMVEYESVLSPSVEEDEIDDDASVQEEFYSDSETSLCESVVFRGFENATNGDNEDDKSEEEEETPLRRSDRSTKGQLPVRYQESTGMARRHVTEPRSFAEAVNGPEAAQWRAAMDDEIQSLKSHGTWKLAKLPADRKAVGSKWIFKRKHDEDGNVVRYKARLVAQGFSQKFGTDFDEVFAPVVRQVTFRTLLTVASARSMLVKHADVKTAYLHGDLDETIFMRQPPGYEVGDKGAVCLLQKSLYGLKQAGHVWNRKLDGVLKKLGFTQSANDPCLYVRRQGKQFTYLVIYVDDMVIACHTEEEYSELIAALNRSFTVTSLGDIRHFLGIQVRRSAEQFSLNQRAYIQKLLERFGLTDAKDSKIPLDPGHLQQKEENERLPNNHQYSSLVGGLLYVAVNTRPDIAVSVSILGRSVSNPSQADWTEAKRTLRYLKFTQDHELVLGPGQAAMEVYVDADWAGDTKTRKSNSGFLVTFGGGPIYWASRKQTCVALSSTEAEFVALAECCKEVQWIDRLLGDFSEDVPRPIRIHEDNQSCIKQLESGRINNRSKHVDTKYHFVRQMKEEGKIAVQYCPTDSMVADMLTKPLAYLKLARFREAAGVQPSRRSVEGEATKNPSKP